MKFPLAVIALALAVSASNYPDDKTSTNLSVISRPPQQTSTYKIGHQCYGSGAECERESLPVHSTSTLDARAADSTNSDWYGANVAKLVSDQTAQGGPATIPTDAFPRQQSGIAATPTAYGGITVHIAKRPSRWNDALSDTIVSPGSFDERHMFNPTQNVAYNPGAAKQCCLDACATSSVADHTLDLTGCNYGCHLWLSKSSLNWESTSWWAKLEAKCKKDCSAKRVWTESGHGATVYEETFYDDLTPEREDSCELGCQKYHTSMQDAACQTAA